MTDDDASDYEPGGYEVDFMGRWFRYGRWEETAPGVARMAQPVRCGFCSGIYDLGAVTVTGHYLDCSLWRTPCCGRIADDRGESGWKSRQDYYRLARRDQPRRLCP